LLDPLDVAVGRAGDRRGRRVSRVFPVEDEIVGGEGLSIVPGHTALELPGDRFAVAPHAAVLDGRNLLGKDGEEIAFGIERRERLVEQPRAVLVLGAPRERRVEQGRRLPPEYLELPAAAPPRRSEPIAARLGPELPGSEKRRRDRRAEAEADHEPGKSAARETGGSNVSDEVV